MIKREGCIYKITSPTGRVYIGQSYNVKDREYRYSKAKCSGQPKIYNSIIKHGWESHRFEIICSGRYTITHLDKLEQDFIAAFESIKNGLNCSSGGNINSFHSKETLLKMSISAKLRKSEANRLATIKSNKERVFTPEMRKKMSESGKKKILTSLHKQRIKDNHVNVNAKLVLNFETGIYYDNGHLASIAHCRNRHTLKNMLNGSKRNKTSLRYV